MEKGKDFYRNLIQPIKLLIAITATLIFLTLIVLYWIAPSPKDNLPKIVSTEVIPVIKKTVVSQTDSLWKAPDTASIPQNADGRAIRYGRELIAHTAKYLGPNGSVAHISNGMNCQNCHLEAGTKTFGNNYSLVAANYPKFRARSGTIEGIEKRVNDCFERSLNGKGLDSLSPEMRSIVAYIKWVGKDVKKNEKVKGAGFVKMALLDRPANPENGKKLYITKCQVCHGTTGNGMKTPGASEYQFPPLWGINSYNDGAGLYRISNFAGFIRANMPLGATYDKPLLSEDEAWDIAAFVNSLPRPTKDISKDWPNIELKPFDHPFGPYADSISEKQHKYGPYKPIIDIYEKSK